MCSSDLSLDAVEEVGVAAPPAVEERGLEDHVRPRAHRREGGVLRGAQLGGALQIVLRDLDDAASLGPQPCEVRRLVRISAILHELHGRVRAARRPLATS